MPFEFNIKCVIFTLVIAGGYWFLPNKNYIILFALLWLPYISMAWYDYYYQCQYSKLKPTPIPFGRQLFLPFKPPDYQQEFSQLTPHQIGIMDTVDHVVLYSLVLAGILFCFYFAFI
jgi:hypothetical protein